MSAFKTSPKSAKGARAKPQSGKTATPTLLAGGNPQIAKREGGAPVRAYIAAMPGRKREIGRRLDALIVKAAPGVRKAVKWNLPLHGVEGRGSFLGIHCFAKAVKVAFFQVASLSPIPPGESKSEGARYLNIRENDELDERQFIAWLSRRADCLADVCKSTRRQQTHERNASTQDEGLKQRGHATPRLPTDRCEDQGAQRLARRDAGPSATAH